MSAAATDLELLEALIGKREARRLRGRPTVDVLETSTSDLIELGLSRTLAIRVSSAAEIARRFQPVVELDRPITDPRSVLPYTATVREAVVESLIAVLLDARLRLIRVVPIATGALAHVAVSAREVLRHPLEHNAAAFVLCHNHPSGDVGPSRPDIEFTLAMATAADTLQ